MRFFIVNNTGTTIHVRLDRDNSDELILTISRKQAPAKGRPVTQYVIASKTPVQIGYLSGNTECTFNNPDKLIARLFHENGKDRIIRIEGFVN